MNNKYTDECHFAFGDNWEDYASNISEKNIIEAEASLRRLLGDNAIVNKSFLDIGCGAGIHSLAAARIGANKILSIDIDPISVKTTKSLFSSRANNHHAINWECNTMSIFDMNPEDIGKFDIVYSWGVLHHTGAMHDAIIRASEFVKPDGIFCIAIYAKTYLCRFWKIEKKIYSRSSKHIQMLIRVFYYIWFWFISNLFSLKTERRFFNIRKYINNYINNRGMTFSNDIHDWLGGFPYESISPEELDRYLSPYGFKLIRKHQGAGGKSGLLGSGCIEYVYQKCIID